MNIKLPRRLLGWLSLGAFGTIPYLAVASCSDSAGTPASSPEAEGGSNGSGASGGSDSSEGGGDSSSAGAGGESEVLLAAGDSESKTIDAADGGSITLGNFRLEIPPGALSEDTEITVTDYSEDAESPLYRLEPSGLEFAEPALARVTIPSEDAPEFDQGQLALPVVLLAQEGEPAEVIDAPTLRRSTDGSLEIAAEIPHFTFVNFLLGDSEPIIDVNPLFLDVESSMPVGTEFALPALVTLTTTKVEFSWWQGTTLLDHAGYVEADLSAAAVTSINGWWNEDNPVVVPTPDERNVVNPPEPLSETEPVLLDHLFMCSEVGQGTPGYFADIQAEISLELANIVLEPDPSNRYGKNTFILKSIGKAEKVSFTTYPVGTVSGFPITCTDSKSILISIGLQKSDEDDLLAAFKSALTQSCYDRSDYEECGAVNPGGSIVATMDPLLTVGSQAADRLEEMFPCGEGPVGLTVCGTPGAFAEGDYVFLLSTYGADIPLDDPDGMYQHAFVFDSDGIEGNNYEPSSEYPKDFFAGTDMWYQLFYTPGPGFSTKVVDARVDQVNGIPSGVRFVIAGRELAAFIPRAELDADPSFRVTTFRHEGDYGLSGGPWYASYYPLLGEPLLPAAAGDAIVVPEN
jgi:hypothetical protein